MALHSGRVSEHALMSAKCKVFLHSWQGQVTIEQLPATRKIVWVARLECTNCHSKRMDVMVPNTCELISRYYDRQKAINYDTAMAHAEAKKILYKSMLVPSTVESTGKAN